MSPPTSGDRPASSSDEFRFDHHPRTLSGTRFVYAVLSRRARGISVGVNLNPDKICNFDCVYCQVDRSQPPVERRVDRSVLELELQTLLFRAANEGPAALARIDHAPVGHRRVADVAFSGDGEPTSYPEFAQIVSRTAEIIDEILPGLPMTLITNATLFHRPQVRAGLDVLAARGGRIWAKLDAGSEEFYRRVAVTSIPFQRVLENILEEARRRPLVIQSLFFRDAGQAPPLDEIEAYADRLAEIDNSGGKVDAVQVTTVARRPPSPSIEALSAEELDAIARTVRLRLPESRIEVYAAGGSLDEGGKR